MLTICKSLVAPFDDDGHMNDNETIKDYCFYALLYQIYFWSGLKVWQDQIILLAICKWLVIIFIIIIYIV